MLFLKKSRVSVSPVRILRNANTKAKVLKCRYEQFGSHDCSKRFNLLQMPQLPLSVMAYIVSWSICPRSIAFMMSFGNIHFELYPSQPANSLISVPKDSYKSENFCIRSMNVGRLFMSPPASLE